jgi:hypothetical protein
MLTVVPGLRWAMGGAEGVAVGVMGVGERLGLTDGVVLGCCEAVAVGGGGLAVAVGLDMATEHDASPWLKARVPSKPSNRRPKPARRATDSGSFIPTILSER